MSLEEYNLLERKVIPEKGMTGLWYRHACGMEVVSIECDDVENMFCIGLTTPPENDCGTSHIIEHSVLAGSVRYPVRDPFMEMIKSSVATFINALTYHDHTIYPVASTVPLDFFNLSSVYFDAVFNPLMSRQSFLQEGWHYEFERPGDTGSRLLRNGVVLNEMNGAMADIDEIIEIEVNRRLFPMTSRRFVSGGHPDKIGGLSYGRYRDYYLRHYHPSRSRVYFYGSIPTGEKLSFLSGLLATLTERPVPAPIAERSHQERWTRPRRARVKFTPPVEDLSNGEGAWAQAFYLTDDWEPLTDIGFEFLDELLLGNDSSPLRLAILESGLCDNLAVSGYDNETLDTSFLIAANGVPRENFPKLERLVRDCLLDVAEKGFSEKQLNASMTQFKVAHKEMTSSYVYRKMESVFDVWCYGKNPFMYLDSNAIYSRFEQKILSEPTWLQGLVKKYLCDNPHCLTLELTPDMSLQEKREEKARGQLERLRGRMSPGKLAKIDIEARELKALQGSPNAPEALATLPKLERKDVPDRPVMIKTSRSLLANGIDFIDVDCPTNGLSYMEFMLPLGSLSLVQLRTADAFYKNLFRRVGTTLHSHEALDAALAENGVFMACNKVYWEDAKGVNGGLRFVVRSLDEYFQCALDLLKECIEHTIFTESAHICNRLRQISAGLRDSIAQGGLNCAIPRSSMGLSMLATLREFTCGFNSASILVETASKFRSRWPALRDGLEEVGSVIAALKPRLALFEGGDETRGMAVDFLESFSGKGQGTLLDLTGLELGSGRCEGLANGSGVSSFVRTFSGPRFSDLDSIPLAVYINMLSCGYLYDEVRLKGGAYDVDGNYESLAGLLSLYSGRDPQPWRTRQVFDGLQRVQGFTEEEVSKSVLSTIKGSFAQIRASGALAQVLVKHLHGITPEIEIARFRRYMTLTLKDVTEAAERFWDGKPQYNDFLIGSANAMKGAEIDVIKL